MWLKFVSEADIDRDEDPHLWVPDGGWIVEKCKRDQGTGKTYYHWYDPKSGEQARSKKAVQDRLRLSAPAAKNGPAKEKAPAAGRAAGAAAGAAGAARSAGAVRSAAAPTERQQMALLMEQSRREEEERRAKGGGGGGKSKKRSRERGGGRAHKAPRRLRVGKDRAVWVQFGVLKL